MLLFYGYKKCDTCRKAEKRLAALGIAYSFIDITEKPPDAATLKRVAEQAALEVKRLFNISGVQYREQNIKERLVTLSDSELLTLLAANGRLIKRPLVTDGQRATVGFNESTFDGVWRAK